MTHVRNESHERRICARIVRYLLEIKIVSRDNDRTRTGKEEGSKRGYYNCVVSIRCHSKQVPSDWEVSCLKTP